MTERYEKWFSHHEQLLSLSDSPHDYIKFYDQNRVIFDNPPEFSSVFDMKMHLSGIEFYANKHLDLGHYTKAKDFAQKAIQYAENYKGEFHYDPVRSPESRHLILWTRAIASYHLKDYHQAEKDFKLLYELDPEADKVKDWLKYCQVAKRQKIANGVGVLAILLLLLNFLPGVDWPFYFHAILIIALFILFFYPRMGKEIT